MRIITKESDFYDSVLGYGVDNTIIYKREKIEHEMLVNGWRGRSVFGQRSHIDDEKYAGIPNEIKSVLEKIRENAIDRSFDVSDNKKSVSLNESYILFCGELIPFILVTGKTSAHPNEVVRKKGEFSYEEFKEGFYSLEDLISFLESVFDKDLIMKYMKGSSRSSNISRFKVFDEFFKIGNGLSFENAHHKIDAPAILIGPVKYTSNPVLKEIKFARKYDPFTTYQKIEQFISGVMGGRSPKMVEIADIDRLVGHGFDKKTSFRKAKEK